MTGEPVNPKDESDRLLRKSLAEMERGETIPAEEVFKQLAERLGIEYTPKNDKEVAPPSSSEAGKRDH